jgi:hypothetical protein
MRRLYPSLNLHRYNTMFWTLANAFGLRYAWLKHHKGDVDVRRLISLLDAVDDDAKTRRLPLPPAAMGSDEGSDEGSPTLHRQTPLTDGERREQTPSLIPPSGVSGTRLGRAGEERINAASAGKEKLAQMFFAGADKSSMRAASVAAGDADDDDARSSTTAVGALRVESS